jgi:hypothetical protein
MYSSAFGGAGAFGSAGALLLPARRRSILASVQNRKSFLEFLQVVNVLVAASRIHSSLLIVFHECRGRRWAPQKTWQHTSINIYISQKYQSSAFFDTSLRGSVDGWMSVRSPKKVLKLIFN